LALLAGGCAPAGGDAQVRSRGFAIIDGSAAKDAGEVVWVSLGARREVCSGVLIAPSVVVTALHCVAQDAIRADASLASGIRVGFGEDVQALSERDVTSVDWTSAPAVLVVDDARTRGEDIAVLELSAPAPGGVVPDNVRFDYMPLNRQRTIIAGFGTSSLATGATGTRLQAATRVTGFDPSSGIVQVSGPSACFGDSGGPLLLADTRELIGVIMDSGGSSDASFCDVDLTFAVTTANPDVSELLRRSCARAGGCGPRFVHDAGADGGAREAFDARAPSGRNDAEAGDAGRVHSGGNSRPDAAVDAPHDASTTGSMSRGSPSSGGCDCAMGSRTARDPSWIAFHLVVLLILRGRRASKQHDLRHAALRLNS
jgi:hypothetical protein